MKTAKSMNRLVTITSFLLVAAGIIFLVLNVVLQGSIQLQGLLDSALPLLVLMLGAAFFLLVGPFSKRISWAAWLYLPGALVSALGLVILLNVLTADWNAWAYAWLLLLAGAGAGIALAGRQLDWRNEIILTGYALVVAGVTLFALFGLLVGGKLILVAAPLLMIAGGLGLYWLRPGSGLSEQFFERFTPPGPLTEYDEAQKIAVPMAEPLSPRELEVLRLIEQGLSNNEIAARLTIATSTIKTHINNIYGKLGVQTRVQALNRARELGYLRD